MKKSLRNLAKVAAGLGAAYALTKMGKTETSEADSLRMQNQADQEDASTSAFAKKNARISDAQRMSNQAAQEDASRAAFAKANKVDTFASDSPISLNPKTGLYGEPGSLEGFRASEAARRAKISGSAISESPDSPRAKLKARLGRSKGGSVIARGNKLTRNKPTQLF